MTMANVSHVNEHVKTSEAQIVAHWKAEGYFQSPETLAGQKRA